MGACYSKHPSFGNSSKSKAPTLKCHPTNDSGPLLNGKEYAPEQRGHRASSKLTRPDSEDVLIVSSNLFLYAESGQGERAEKVRNGGVAPSDSGIESIGTIPDDAREISFSADGRSDLSKRLQRLSRGSCYKCGNFKLDDSAITALLSNTYCSCGPRQAGRSNINPRCQTHGDRNIDKGQDSSINDSSVDASGMCLEIITGNNYGESREDLNISKQSEISNFIFESDSEVLAPLAHFDSIDLNLNDFPSQKSSKRRSLLSEILDLTDSICKCDFYSNEYCCFPERHVKNEFRDSGFNATKDALAPLPEKSLTDVSFESEASDVTITRSENEECLDPAYSYVSKSKLCSPRKTGLSKNVSFANGNVSEDLIEKACSQSSFLSLNKLHYKSVKESDTLITSEASSGIYTHCGSVSETHLISIKDSPKRTLSLINRAALLSFSSNETLDERTEDDLASLDLDSLSRATSLSYGSIRQLVESTEDLVQPLEDVKRVVVDGEDCVAIPVDTYFQLQSDLASLKQQLVYLSSLMQEVCDRREPDQQALSASFGL